MLAGLELVEADQSVSAVAARIFAALAPPFDVAGRHLEVRASIGYAIGPHDGRDPEDLHRAAHATVAAVKQAGRGELLRYRPGTGDAMRQMSVDHRLRRAIERGAVKPYFQPIIDLATGETCALEALARWESRDELLEPARFVPIAEESSLIIDLDVHMIRQVCRAARQAARPRLATAAARQRLSADRELARIRARRPPGGGRVRNRPVGSDDRAH